MYCIVIQTGLILFWPCSPTLSLSLVSLGLADSMAMPEQYLSQDLMTSSSPKPGQHFFSLYMFFGEPAVHFSQFFLCCPSQRSACSQVPSQVATHQEMGNQLWAGETPDSNPGLQDNSLAHYRWATTPTRHHATTPHHTNITRNRAFTESRLPKQGLRWA